LNKNKKKDYLYILDIDGTLIDSGGAGRKSMEKACESLFGQTIKLNAKDVAGRTDSYIFKHILKKIYPKNRFSVDLTEFKTVYIRNLLEELRDKPTNYLKGAREFTDFLEKSSGYTPALLTGNFKKAAKIKLKEIADKFEFGAYGDIKTNRNDLFFDALGLYQKKYNKNPDKTVVIGDTPFDIECAIKGNAISVAVSTGPYSKEDLKAADFVLEDLSQWPSLLESI